MPTTRYRVTYIFDATFSPEEIQAWAKRVGHQQIAAIATGELVGMEVENEEPPETTIGGEDVA